jgi:hypothetical protein
MITASHELASTIDGTVRMPDIPEQIRGREFSAVPTNAEPYIDGLTMHSEYGEPGVSVLALCADDQGFSGVAVVRHEVGRHGRVAYGVVPYNMQAENGPRFSFGYEVPLMPGDPPVAIDSVPGMYTEKATIGGGSIWLNLHPSGMPYTRKPSSVIMIDPGTSVVPKTIWARERYPI